MSEYTCDLAIIGGGPAALTAAIYAARARLDTLLVSSAGLGGTVAIIDIIENYPGSPEGITGFELAEKMAAQARRFGARELLAAVDRVERLDDSYILRAGHDVVQARSVIVASGSSHRHLNVPGEDRFLGKGVSYCATCDGAFFRNREIVVVGGGDSAVKEALYLTRYASKVTIIHRRDELRAERIIQEQALTNEKICFKWNSSVTEIIGQRLVEAVKIKNTVTGEEELYPTRGVFVFVGMEPQSGMVRDLLSLDEHGNIRTDAALGCGLPGIWAAGDIRTGSPRQVATAVGDGCQCALAAIAYLQNK